MANVTWITTRKHLTAERVGKDMRRLVAEKFGDAGKVTVPDCPDHPDDPPGFWDVVVPFEELDAGCSVTLKTRNRVTFKAFGYEISDWFGTWLRNELGVLYGGMCGGEDADARWEPDNTKYRTYRQYVETMHHRWRPEDRAHLLEGLGEMVDR